jgi:peptidylprolyl isomerase
VKIKRSLHWRMLAAIFILVLITACSPSEPEEPTPTPTSTPGIIMPVFPDVPTGETVDFEIPEDAVETETGLYYVELTEGTGANPVEGDLVTMHFLVTLPDGTEVANSKNTGEPITVIKGRDQLLVGWEEGLNYMKAGGVTQLFVPPYMAFGEAGYGLIPPNTQISILIELLTVEKPPQPSIVAENELTTTESGLQYADLMVGEGNAVHDNSIVRTHFTLWVKNTDSNDYIVSSMNSEPLSFVVGRGDTVFPGWEEGMLNMQVGGKRLLVIPPVLGFGEIGGNGVPANATLIMEVELVELSEPPAQTQVNDDDYITTESGLKYFDIVVGEGESPNNGELVYVHYTGWLETGEIFDSSVERGDPFTFVLGVGNVIPGWDEGVLSMKVGGKRQLVIPADLAYGEQGAGNVIPPGATLIFEIELLSITR